MLNLVTKAVRQGKKMVHTMPLSRGLATATLPDLPYDYGALEPYIDAHIMELHHSKHHQTYVTMFNQFAAQTTDAEAKNDVSTVLKLQPSLKFHGGGHLNHSIFWTNLAPASQDGGGQPDGQLGKLIDAKFGDFAKFQTAFNTAAAGVQGSGWAWLGYNHATGGVEIHTTANQDPLLHVTPILGVDVWEHAYYLQYENRRPEYLTAIWNVVNWKNVSQRLADAQ